MEIRDALTLELVSVLQSAKVGARFRRGLAYSPDGRSLAGCSDGAIVLWDTQTGGVVDKIECEFTGDGLELVWSLDGKTIGTISPRVLETCTIHAYDIASGTTQSPGTVESREKPYLWAHGDSFRIATTTEWDRKGYQTIDVFEVGTALNRIESFTFQLDSPFQVFSPATYRISASTTGNRSRGDELLILDIRTSEVLLREPGSYWRNSFSPDGNALAAFSGDHLHIWRYNSGRYTRWREFQQQTPAKLQFSPTLSSILGHADTLLRVLHLDCSSTTLVVEPVIPARGIPRDAYPPHGGYIATTHRGETTIAITNLRLQDPSPSQFIDTDFEISEIVLTGNVLLVNGSDTVVAWLLTEEGAVDGVFGNRRASRNDSLWNLPTQDTNPQGTSSQSGGPSFWARFLQREGDKRSSDRRLGFSVGDGIGVVGDRKGFDNHIYHLGTGEILEPNEARPRPTGPTSGWYHFRDPTHRDDCDLYHRNQRKHREPPEHDWPVSQTTLQGGWVRDPGGKHRLWLHPRWRTTGNDVDWFDEVTTMRLKNPSELIIVKF